MTYEFSGKQYVVITVGGIRELLKAQGDAIVAFAFP